MLVQCPSCAKKLNVPDSAAGKKAKCPACTKIFDIVAPTAVAAAPVAPAPPPPPVRRADDEEEDRPRRRPREEDDDEDDRPRGQRRGRDEEGVDDLEVVDDEDERPARRRGGSVQKMADTVSWWLKLAGFLLIGYFVVYLINSYFSTAAALSRVNEILGALPKGNQKVKLNIPATAMLSPLMSVVFGLIGGLVILGPCLVFIFLGASKAAQLRGRGFVMAGLIIAIVLGSLGAIGIVFEMLAFLVIFQFFAIIHLMASIANTTVLLLAGIKGLSIMGRPAMKEAFAANDRRPRRSRDRDERDDDEDDDRDHRRRRRNRDEE